MYSNPAEELARRIPLVFKKVKHPGKNMGGCTFYEEYKPLKKENWKESELQTVLWQTSLQVLFPRRLAIFFATHHHYGPPPIKER